MVQVLPREQGVPGPQGRLHFHDHRIRVADGHQVVFPPDPADSRPSPGQGVLHLDPGVPEDRLDVPLYQRLDQPAPAVVTVAEDLVELPFQFPVALRFFLLPLGPFPLPLLLSFPEPPVEFDGLLLPLRLSSGFLLRGPASLRREIVQCDPGLPGGGGQDAPHLRRGPGGPSAARPAGHEEFSPTP